MTEIKKIEPFEVRVKTNSSKSSIELVDSKYVVFLKSLPVDDLANKELIKLFKKSLKKNVEIVFGFKSRNKKIKFLS